MEKSNVPYIKEQLKAALGGTYNESIHFVFQIDPEDKNATFSYTDARMLTRILPSYVGQRLSLDEICDILVTDKNEMPLYIKIQYIHETLILLWISKRFRKKNVIEEKHGADGIQPFILDRVYKEKRPNQLIRNYE